MLAFVGFVTVTFIIEAMACANATIQWRKIESHKVDVSEILKCFEAVSVCTYLVLISLKNNMDFSALYYHTFSS